MVERPTVTPATGTGAIDTTTTVGAAMRLNSITLKLDAAPTTSEDFTVTIDANDGSDYDAVLLAVDLSEDSTTDLLWIPEEPISLEVGDEIKVEYTNTDGNTFGLRIVTELI